MFDRFANQVDTQKLRVHAPTKIIFLCGGETTDITEENPKSLRDVFLRIHHELPLADTDVRRAEDINLFYVQGAMYKDLLRFEVELAQVTEIIILFSESEGSLAELGAFSVIEEIAQRVLVFILNEHYVQESFIKFGPITSLENRDNGSIHVLDGQQLKYKKGDFQHFNVEEFKSAIKDKIAKRTEQIINHSTFNSSLAGHKIKLAVGLVQEFGGLTDEEIFLLFAGLNIDCSEDELQGYLLCAKTTGWIFYEKRGDRKFYFALSFPDAATFIMKAGSEKIDKLRRRTAIREYWQETDKDRYSGITKHSGQVA